MSLEILTQSRTRDRLTLKITRVPLVIALALCFISCRSSVTEAVGQTAPKSANTEKTILSTVGHAEAEVTAKFGKPLNVISMHRRNPGGPNTELREVKYQTRERVKFVVRFIDGAFDSLIVSQPFKKKTDWKVAAVKAGIKLVPMSTLDSQSGSIVPVPGLPDKYGAYWLDASDKYGGFILSFSAK